MTTTDSTSNRPEMVIAEPSANEKYLEEIRQRFRLSSAASASADKSVTISDERSPLQKVLEKSQQRVKQERVTTDDLTEKMPIAALIKKINWLSEESTRSS